MIIVSNDHTLLACDFFIFKQFVKESKQYKGNKSNIIF